MSKTRTVDEIQKDIMLLTRLHWDNHLRAALGLPKKTLEEYRVIQKAGEYHGA
jgi:hypothetical protein